MDNNAKKIENTSPPAENLLENAVETAGIELQPDSDNPTTGAKQPEKTIKQIKMPEFLTVSPSPHIKSPETTATIMLDVLIALLPAYIWGVYVFGIRALAIGVISIAACIGFEAAAQFILHRPITIKDLSAAVTGLLLAMNLPATVPLWMPVVGAFFAIVIVKQLFGGIGKNFVNPALAARVFLFSWASEMTTFSQPGQKISSLAAELNSADIIAGATPLAALKAGQLPDANLFDMLIGNIGGCIGEVSSLLLIAGGIYLIFFRRVITWHIPVAYIGTVAVLTFLFPQHGGVALDFMLCELLSGGLILGAIFMATDYATSPVTPVGRILYGIGCGLITVMIRYFGSYPEGVSFSILIMNMLVWYLDKATMPRRFGGKTHGK